MKYFSSRYCSAPGSQALATPTSLSGASAKSTICAIGPVMAMRSITAGTSTSRPTESVNSTVSPAAAPSVAAAAGGCVSPAAGACAGVQPANSSAAASSAGRARIPRFIVHDLLFSGWFAPGPGPDLRPQRAVPLGMSAASNTISPSRLRSGR